MGGMARFISGKSGGLGEVVAALCEGLTVRGIECHLATLDLKKRFQQENNVDESAWRDIRYKVDPDKVHLVSSSIFANLLCAYAGNLLLNAAEFQKQVVNNIIKTVRAKNGGRLILHSHDWMAGGAITAYAKSRGCPVLHTVHNVHTGHIPVDMLFGVDVDSLTWNIYFLEEYGKRCVDSQATAIKSATLVNFVGEKLKGILSQSCNSICVPEISRTCQNFTDVVADYLFNSYFLHLQLVAGGLCSPYHPPDPFARGSVPGAGSRFPRTYRRTTP